VKVKALIKLLEQNGWAFERFGKGDHKIYKHPDYPDNIAVDGQSNDDIPKGTLGKTLKRAGLK
jgi:predicted RNA binding protein YcfA (HicA-like mRNA interferase family)